MKKDLPGVVKQIAQFMGVALSESEFAEVVRQSSYKYMKSIGHKFDPVGLSPPWVQPTGAMMRKGKSGAAGELLTLEDQQRIDSYWQTELAKLESDFPYAEAFVVANEKAAVSSASE